MYTPAFLGVRRRKRCRLSLISSAFASSPLQDLSLASSKLVGACEVQRQWMPSVLYHLLVPNQLKVHDSEKHWRDITRGRRQRIDHANSLFLSVRYLLRSPYSTCSNQFARPTKVPSALSPHSTSLRLAGLRRTLSTSKGEYLTPQAFGGTWSAPDRGENDEDQELESSQKERMISVTATANCRDEVQFAAPSCGPSQPQRAPKLSSPRTPRSAR
jgi:hypothetical protein